MADDKKINKDLLIKEKYMVDYATGTKSPSKGDVWAKVLGKELGAFEKDTNSIYKKYGEYLVDDMLNIDSGKGIVSMYDKKGNKIVSEYYVPENKYSFEEAQRFKEEVVKELKKGMVSEEVFHAPEILKGYEKIYQGGVDVPYHEYGRLENDFKKNMLLNDEINKPSSSKELVPYSKEASKDKKQIEKALWTYMSEERPYVPLKYTETTGGPNFKERYSALKKLAKKMGYSGLKSLGWLGLPIGVGVGVATGDVMGAVPGVGPMLSSEDVGQGSDVVPYQMKYTPKSVLPPWLEIK